MTDRKTHPFDPGDWDGATGEDVAAEIHVQVVDPELQPHRDQVADLILVSPETGQPLIVSSDLAVSGRSVIFEVSNDDERFEVFVSLIEKNPHDRPDQKQSNQQAQQPDSGDKT